MSSMESPPAQALLAWYDRHRRALPWRAVPGESADPYRVWLSEIMLQQTTVKAVIPYFQAFVRQWPDVAALANAAIDDVMRAWAGLGYYSRARNLHACAKEVVAAHGGTFPRDAKMLKALPGIGDYTAGAIASIAYGLPEVALDGNVERVMSRLFACDEALPGARPKLKALAASLLPQDRPGDYAQALMDLGATICTPKSPACALCPWQSPCAAKRAGQQTDFPVKAPKKAGALRQGYAFLITNETGALLVRTRPPKGLLGGTVEVPNSDWTNTADPAARHSAPLVCDFREIGRVRHVFTHFPLELTVMAGTTKEAAPPGYRFVGSNALENEAFSGLMQKVIALKC